MSRIAAVVLVVGLPLTAVACQGEEPTPPRTVNGWDLFAPEVRTHIMDESDCATLGQRLHSIGGVDVTVPIDVTGDEPPPHGFLAEVILYQMEQHECKAPASGSGIPGVTKVGEGAYGIYDAIRVETNCRNLVDWAESGTGAFFNGVEQEDYDLAAQGYVMEQLSHLGLWMNGC